MTLSESHRVSLLSYNFSVCRLVTKLDHNAAYFDRALATLLPLAQFMIKQIVPKQITSHLRTHMYTVQLIECQRTRTSVVQVRLANLAQGFVVFCELFSFAMFLGE